MLINLIVGSIILGIALAVPAWFGGLVGQAIVPSRSRRLGGVAGMTGGTLGATTATFLYCAYLLRLPHEDLIRPERELTDKRGSEDSAAPPRPQLNKEASTKGTKTSPADYASLADLEGAKTTSLAKSDVLGWQIASLADSASQAIPAGLANRVERVSLMDSLPESAGSGS